MERTAVVIFAVATVVTSVASIALAFVRPNLFKNPKFLRPSLTLALFSFVFFCLMIFLAIQTVSIPYDKDQLRRNILFTGIPVVILLAMSRFMNDFKIFVSCIVAAAIISFVGVVIVAHIVYKDMEFDEGKKRFQRDNSTGSALNDQD